MQARMQTIKLSPREKPKVSLILLDWRVRESLHLLHYLKNQTVSRDSFEVIVIEYYDHVSPAVQMFESEIDTWLLLQMPEDSYYHKHLMYNAGLVFSRGDILMFGDSDAMVRPTFIERIVTSFEKDPHLVYHMDEFRNVRRDFYPFNYPTFEDVLRDGCINNVGGKTKGVLDTVDPIHTRNYGACMCARRNDIIDIAGADEDLSYLGHICGPYDMTFRLMNFGRRLVWETDEYLYHTWHPGTDGTDNYLGPHDGRNMSTTALQALTSGRIHPLVENKAIRELRVQSRRDKGPTPKLLDLLVDPAYNERFNRERLSTAAPQRALAAAATSGTRTTKSVFATYKGFDVYQDADLFYGVPEKMRVATTTRSQWRSDDRVIKGASFSEICSELDNWEARLIESVSNFNICAIGERYAIVPQTMGAIDFRVRKQRDDDRILWTDSLADARHLVSTLAKPMEESPIELKADLSIAPAVTARSESILLLQVEQLNRRVAQLETGVANIYGSRIWRVLVKIGGIINVFWKHAAH
jgi:hypothetical protein